jgi:PPM family protein phosphatase
MNIQIEAAGRTHIGLVRRRNEDSLYVGASLFAVADGLGGHVAGDVASSTAVSVLPDHDHVVSPDELPTALGQTINHANRALRGQIEARPDVSGMGTTLVALMVSGTAAVLANVGDSRAYRFRRSDPRGTTQVTEDHTYQHLLADARDVPALPERLSRFLDGRAEGRSPDLTTLRLAPGDRILLCSDGLSSYVPHELIDDAMRSPMDPEETAERLVSLAIDHGGHDNVTVIVIEAR